MSTGRKTKGGGADAFMLPGKHKRVSVPSSSCSTQMTRTHESVEGLAGTLERVHDVKRGDGLPLGVLSVCGGSTKVSFYAPDDSENIRTHR